MNRQKKGRLSILAVAVLLVLSLFDGFVNSSFKEVYASTPNEGVFHLKKYVDVSENHEATGQEEDTTNPSNSLYGKEVVADVVYEIYRTHDYVNGQFEKIATGSVQILDNGENYKTDSNGEINITGLPLGQYTFKEVSAPDGIQINTNEYSFALPYSLKDDANMQYEVYVYPKNVRLTGSLSFKKVGDNGTDGLKNVEFEVYNEDGTPVKDAEGSTLKVTTRLSGEVLIKDLQIGKYYLLETKNPDSDYLESNATKLWFEIYSVNNEVKTKSFYTNASMAEKVKDANGGDLAEATIINYKKPSVEKTAAVKNEQDIKDGKVYVDDSGNLYANVDIPYTYTIKTTLPKDLIQYTKFEIYDPFSTGNIVLVTPLADLKPVAIGGSSQPVLTKGKDFEVIREGAGGYRIKLTTEGIKVLASAKCTSVEITFDAKIPAGYQVDGTAKIGENNDAVVEFVTDHSDPSISTNQNTVYPRAGEIIIHKVDRNDQSKLLSGATFSLKDAAGKEYWGTKNVSYLDVKGNPTANASNAATFIFTQLPFGTYSLQETKAPSGYIISSVAKTIQLSPDGDKTKTWISHEEFFKNYKSESELPKTGDQTNILPYIIALVCCCIVGSVYIYRRRKNKVSKK